MSELAGPVIVVDDDAATRNSLKFALGVEGLDVRLYESGAALLAEPHLPERACLVVDYNMPRMNGFELVRRLRDRHGAFPAVLITSDVTEDLVGLADEVGFCKVLEKPLMDDALLDWIEDILARVPPRSGSNTTKIPH
jgi:FixJ family two-component response regulator